jgi:arylsulfatase A-like enzyme
VPYAAACLSVAIATLSLLGGCNKAPRSRPPNVVLVTIDTLRADHLGSYGYEHDTSPNLDRFADDSARFSDAVSVSSWTLPGHASIMTGLFPSQHGVKSDMNALPPSADTLAERLKQAGYSTFAATSHVYLSRRWGFDQGFDEYDQRAAVGSPHKPVATSIVDSAIEWLRGAGFLGGEPDKPFFAWLHVFDPHWDYAPPAPFSTQFDGGYDGTMRGDYASLRPFIKAVVGYDQPPPLPERDLSQVNALYDGEIAYVDSEVGRFFEVLREYDQFDDALIVVTSDHGEEMMEHGSLEGHQWTLYEEVVRVPLIIQTPSGGCMDGTRDGGGRVIARSVSTVGVAATVLDCVGVEADELPSLFGLLQGRTDYQSAAVDELLLDLTVRHRTRTVALRTPEHKLIHTVGGSTELYGPPAVGAEAENLAAQDPETAGRLKARLDARLAELEPLADAGVVRQALDQMTVDRLRATGYMD